MYLPPIIESQNIYLMNKVLISVLLALLLYDFINILKEIYPHKMQEKIYATGKVVNYKAYDIEGIDQSITTFYTLKIEYKLNEQTKLISPFQTFGFKPKLGEKRIIVIDKFDNDKAYVQPSILECIKVTIMVIAILLMFVLLFLP